MILKIREALDGNWAELHREDDGLIERVYEGHSIPEHVWIAMLEKMGVEVHYEDGDFCACGGWVPEGTECGFCETYVPGWDEVEE